MPNHIPSRPWLEPVHAHFLTEQDLAKLDSLYSRWVGDDRTDRLGVDIVAYVRDEATELAKVRDLIGPDDIPLPGFVGTVDRVTEWERDADKRDCYREIDALTNDLGDLQAVLEIEQYALSGNLSARVRIEEGYTDSPEELLRWAEGLVALAGRWTEIAREAGE